MHHPESWVAIVFNCIAHLGKILFKHQSRCSLGFVGVIRLFRHQHENQMDRKVWLSEEYTCMPAVKDKSPIVIQIALNLQQIEILFDILECHHPDILSNTAK